MINVSEPRITEDMAAAAERAIRSGWISSSGEDLIKFEETWASFNRKKYGVAVSNGTAALELAVKSLSLPEGSEVILPSFTIVSCAQAIVYGGLTPVFVDVNPENFCINLDQVEAAITPKTRAILIVHMYGHPVDLDQVAALKNKYGILVIEDAAQVHGATYQGLPLGSFGDLSTFSFFANKVITTGEGGMILTDDEFLAERCRSLRNLCFEPGRRFCHNGLGYNYRMTNIQAALALPQINDIDNLVRKKKAIARRYHHQLAGHEQFRFQSNNIREENIYWMNGIVFERGSQALCAHVVEFLRQSGVETRPFFTSLAMQPPFEKFPRSPDLTVSKELETHGIYLPSGLTLQDAQIDYVSEKVKEAISCYV